MRKLSVSLLAGAVVATGFGIGAVGANLDRQVMLSVDCKVEQANFFGTTVSSLLSASGIELGEHDQVWPSKNAKIGEGDVVEVKYGRPITMTVDGKVTTFWTTATTLDEALNQIGMRDSANRLSVDRSLPIGREGITLTVFTPKSVTLKVGGESKEILTTAGTVAEVLQGESIKLGQHDKLSPGLGTQITGSMVITVDRVSVENKEESEPIDFEIKKTDDPNLPKGVERVIVEGVKGEKIVRARVTIVNGVEKNRQVLEEKIVKDPKAEEKAVGTMEIAGLVGHEDRMQLMSDAGISVDDFAAAYKLIQRESEWRPGAVNASSGACGLVQALPCSKLGSNWTDPVHALKWGDRYVKARYGGWKQALAHSDANGWY